MSSMHLLGNALLRSQFEIELSHRQQSRMIPFRLEWNDDSNSKPTAEWTKSWRKQWVSQTHIHDHDDDDNDERKRHSVSNCKSWIISI